MLDQITHLLHQELARKLQRADNQQETGATVSSPASRPNSGHIDPRPALRARVAQLIAEGVDDAILIRAATEFLLRNEFGNELANTAPFHEMADHVAQTLATHPEFKAALLAALE
ncbi:hypothetical protein [Burkholderia ambifaria]|uniref:hypothetical protein n=1 Tax=Burkholderia ambifaria TaxID=152480 RepID=UPI00158C7162|nr:hypothetical protein [Burkholderia ambifaria]